MQCPKSHSVFPDVVHYIVNNMMYTTQGAVSEGKPQCFECLRYYTPFKLGEIPVTFLHVNSSRLSVFYFQNHLLAVGWNKSEATQKDVEKTLNCCGFSHINYNGSCAAVSICCEQERGSCARVILLLNFLPHFLLPLDMLSQHALAIL